MQITHDADGATTLRGPVVDQAALYGLIGRARDLGLTLLAVNRILADGLDDFTCRAAHALTAYLEEAMNSIMSAIRRHPLTTFFLLAYAITWSLVALLSVSLVFAVLGLFGPTLAAVLVLATTDGWPAVRPLFGRLAIWRVSVGWYIVAIGLPIVLALAAIALHVLLGGDYTLRLGDSPLLLVTLAILVVGEELGWRGYALPRLQARYSGLIASLILGVLWAAWHLANGFIPGLERYWYGFPAFLVWVTAQTVLFTWIANHTRGSVLLAWLFHAAINVCGSLFALPDAVRQWWLSAAVYSVAALLVVLVEGPNLTRNAAPPARSRRAGATWVASEPSAGLPGIRRRDAAGGRCRTHRALAGTTRQSA